MRVRKCTFIRVWVRDIMMFYELGAFDMFSREVFLLRMSFVWDMRYLYTLLLRNELVLFLILMMHSLQAKYIDSSWPWFMLLSSFSLLSISTPLALVPPTTPTTNIRRTHCPQPQAATSTTPLFPSPNRAKATCAIRQTRRRTTTLTPRIPPGSQFRNDPVYNPNTSTKNHNEWKTPSATSSPDGCSSRVQVSKYGTS